jgi:hypothetical protein
MSRAKEMGMAGARRAEMAGQEAPETFVGQQMHATRPCQVNRVVGDRICCIRPESYWVVAQSTRRGWLRAANSSANFGRMNNRSVGQSQESDSFVISLLSHETAVKADQRCLGGKQLGGRGRLLLAGEGPGIGGGSRRVLAWLGRAGPTRDSATESRSSDTSTPALTG